MYIWERVTGKMFMSKNVIYFGKYVTFIKSQMAEKLLEMFIKKRPF